MVSLSISYLLVAIKSKLLMSSALIYRSTGTAFIALVDRDVFVTPENLTLLNDHIVAGPEFYQAD